MKESEAAIVLALCATFDRRTIGRADATAWARVLGDTTIEDACAAVDAWYSERREWIMPADVRTGARLIARRRIGAERRAAIEAELAAENGGAPDDETLTGTPVRLAIESGPLAERIDLYREGRMVGRAERDATAAAKAEAKARRAERLAAARAELATLSPATHPEATDG